MIKIRDTTTLYAVYRDDATGDFVAVDDSTGLLQSTSVTFACSVMADSSRDALYIARRMLCVDAVQRAWLAGWDKPEGDRKKVKRS